MLIIQLGLFIRLLSILIIHLFFSNFIEDDATRYFEDAQNIVNGNFGIYMETFNIFIVYFFSFFLYVSPFKSIFILQAVNILTWYFSAVFLFKSLKILNIKKNVIFCALILYSFLPSSIAITSVPLKESLMLFATNLLIMSYLYLIIKKNKNYIFLFLISNLLFILIHKVFFLFFFTIYACLFLTTCGKNKTSFFIIVLFYIAIFYIYLLGPVIESVNTILLGQYISRASYFENVQIANNIFSFLKFYFLAYVNYNFQPLILSITTLADLIVFIENIVRVALIFIAVKTLLKNFRHNFFSNYLFLFILFFAFEIIWALGTQNWGTAIRHHLPSIGLLLIISSINFKRIKIKKTKNQY